jgi:hypothetical protein
MSYFDFVFLKGNECQFSTCTYEPSICSTELEPSHCGFSKIANYCPKLCNQPICKCGFDSCLNGGFFLASSCSCICHSQYRGVRCENSIISTNNTKECPELDCFNGAKINKETCKCDCK